MTRVAVIGTGRMGLPVCARLVDAGFDVLASDVDATRGDEARRVGAAFTSEPVHAAAAADVVLTILPGSRELGEVAGRIVPCLREPAAWIDMTSASPSVAGEWVARAGGRGV